MELIEKLKRRTLRQLSKKIARLSYNKLESGNLKDNLYEQFKITTPALLIDDKVISIRKETVVVYDRPKGCSPGDTLSVALYTIPIEGAPERFMQILSRYSWTDRCYCIQGNVYFREVSLVEIIGNNELIEHIREQAEAEFDRINQILHMFRKDANHFNTVELPKAINEAISDEQAKREALAESEAQLNSLGLPDPGVV